MMDIVVLAMLVVLPVLAVSIFLVKRRQRFTLHKRIQIVLGIILFAAITAFEIDIQWFSVWEDRADPSPYFDRERAWTCPAGIALFVHLCFAVPTAVLWIYVIVQAVRKFPEPPEPGPHGHAHAFWGWLASAGMFLTAVTGWGFYWLAFVA